MTNNDLYIIKYTSKLTKQVWYSQYKGTYSQMEKLAKSIKETPEETLAVLQVVPYSGQDTYEL